MLKDEHERDPPEAARDLVARAAQEALGDRRRTAADLVVVLDDLELANLARPEVVTRVFRQAVVRHLADDHVQGPIRTRTAQVLRERVSFHLIVPMVEAWLFADRNALAVAGVQAASQVFTEPDLEAFCTNDVRYMGATETECPGWASKRHRKYRPKWLGTAMRERHPKGYIQWLCRDGAAKNCTTYNESKSGGEALGGLMWNEVLGRPGSPFGYLRARLADLSVTLGPPAIDVRIDEDPSLPVAATSISGRRRDNVLRNL